MQKVQVFLRKDQKAALKSLAALTGKRQSDLVRQGVDLIINSGVADQQDWRKAILGAAGIWSDRTDDVEVGLRKAFKKRFPAIYGED